MLRALFSIGLVALAVQGAKADEWRKHWNISGKPELRVSAGDAAVAVESGSDHGIDARLTTEGWAIGGSGIRVEERQIGDRVEIEVKVPPVHWSFGHRNIRLEVRVPRDLSGELHTGDGSITLRDLRGAIRADTGDGSIRGENMEGALDAHTGDGSVHVAGRFDKLQLHTQDGSVEVEVKEGSRLDGDWRIQTGDGSVRVRLPKNLAADIEAHTGDGSIHFDLPLTMNGSRQEHTLAGKLNGGGPTLVLRTGDGSITVSSL